MSNKPMSNNLVRIEQLREEVAEINKGSIPVDVLINPLEVTTGSDENFAVRGVSVEEGALAFERLHSQDGLAVGPTRDLDGFYKQVFADVNRVAESIKGPYAGKPVSLIDDDTLPVSEDSATMQLPPVVRGAYVGFPDFVIEAAEDSASETDGNTDLELRLEDLREQQDSIRAGLKLLAPAMESLTEKIDDLGKKSLSIDDEAMLRYNDSLSAKLKQVFDEIDVLVKEINLDSVGISSAYLGRD